MRDLATTLEVPRPGLADMFLTQKSFHSDGVTVSWSSWCYVLWDETQKFFESKYSLTYFHMTIMTHIEIEE